MDSLPIELHIEIRSYLNITDALNYGLVIKELSDVFSEYEIRKRYKNKDFKSLIKTGDYLGVKWLIEQGEIPDYKDIFLAIILEKSRIFELFHSFEDFRLYIRLAYQIGNLEIIKVLIKNKNINPVEALYTMIIILR